MLCDLLTATGVAGRPGSYWRAQDVRKWAARWGVAGEPGEAAFERAYLAAMIREGRAGTGVFGVRLMGDDIGAATARLATALSAGDFPELCARAFGPTLFIHLTREDRLAQAVSLVRAEQSGLWHVAADGSERQRTAPAGQLRFDAGRIAAVREALAAEDARWVALFAETGVRPVRIDYARLAAALPVVLAELLGVLGCDPGAAAGVAVQTAKMADAVSADWVRRMGG